MYLILNTWGSYNELKFVCSQNEVLLVMQKLHSHLATSKNHTTWLWYYVEELNVVLLQSNLIELNNSHILILEKQAYTSCHKELILMK